jgi:uncharacterized Zn finger protein
MNARPTGRPWSGPWPEKSSPIRVEGGVQARSRRGAIGEQWWSRRFIGVLESLGMSGRLARGRHYARRGQVLGFELSTGYVTAEVQGSRIKPYRVRIQVLPLTARQWDRVEQALAARALFRAKLLAGEMPHEIEEVFTACGTPLFPRSAGDVRSAADMTMSCSCPDWEVPCKHLAAVCYVLAEAFDDDPFGMLAWRGRSREDLLTALRRIAAVQAAETARAAGQGPGRPGQPGPPRDGGQDPPGPLAGLPDTPLAQTTDAFWSPGLSLARLRALPALRASPVSAPDLLLRSFEPPAVAVRGQDLAALLTPAYQRLAGTEG